LQDYQDCLAGDHGDYWQDVAEGVIRQPPPGGRSWQAWRELRRDRLLAVPSPSSEGSSDE
jgi:hypothetical protein